MQMYPREKKKRITRSTKQKGTTCIKYKKLQVTVQSKSSNGSSKLKMPVGNW